MDQHTQPQGDNTRVTQLSNILNSLETRIPRIILRRVDEPLSVMKCETENTNTRVAEPETGASCVDRQTAKKDNHFHIPTSFQEVLVKEEIKDNTLVAEIDAPCVNRQAAKIENDFHIPISLQKIKEEIKVALQTPTVQTDTTICPATVVIQNNNKTATSLEMVPYMEPVYPQNVIKVHEDQTFEDVTQPQRSLLTVPSSEQMPSIEDPNRYAQAEHQLSCYSATCLESGSINCRSESNVLNPAMVWQQEPNDQQMYATEKSKEQEKTAERNCHLDAGKEGSAKLEKCEDIEEIDSVNVPGADFTRSGECSEGNSIGNLAENTEQELKPANYPRIVAVIETCRECDGSGICTVSTNNSTSPDKPYNCKICGKTFSRYSTLWSHKRLHSGDKPFGCSVCGLTFATSTYLKNHSRVHTGERPYACSVCGKQFSQIPHLKNHERIHSGERPYHCQVCNKTFTRYSTLWNHRRIHTGERPYECEICGSAFNQASHLNHHTKVHTGEKPHRCDICNLGFSDKFALKRHRATHEKYARTKDSNVFNNSATSDKKTVSVVNSISDVA